MNFRFLKPAEKELLAAIEFYDVQKQGLGSRFLDEVEAAIKKAIQFPEAYVLVGREIRRIRTRRFPYGLIYKVYQSEIVFIAVMHEKRKPDYWKSRA